ncbi:MAG: hypothetical protein QME64_01345 [bacterium]|nr:hypothetical protein [bacterium]
MAKPNPIRLQTDILKVAQPELVFSFDLDALAGDNEEYELVWDKLETALISVLHTLSRSEKPAIANQRFYLWGQLGTTLNAEDHLCNAYFIYLIPETEITGIKEALTESFKENEIAWVFEENRALDEECIPLFKYEQGKIIRYVFDQIGLNGQEDLGCSYVEFVTWDEDWHICPSVYSIDMAKEYIERCLITGKKVAIQYRKFTIEC